MVKQRKAAAKGQKNSLNDFIHKKLLTPPAILTIALFVGMGILFVFTRMKGIEQNYQFSQVADKINELRIVNKELKAEKARALSVNNLQRFAKKFHLSEPSEKQVIIIP